MVQEDMACPMAKGERILVAVDKFKQTYHTQIYIFLSTGEYYAWSYNREHRL